MLPRPFFFLTSQPALQFLVRKPNPAGKFAKWICELQEFSFTFIIESITRASLADLLIGKEEEEETNVKRELCEVLETPLLLSNCIWMDPLALLANVGLGGNPI